MASAIVKHVDCAISFYCTDEELIAESWNKQSVPVSSILLPNHVNLSNMAVICTMGRFAWSKDVCNPPCMYKTFGSRAVELILWRIMERSMQVATESQRVNIIGKELNWKSQSHQYWLRTFDQGLIGRLVWAVCDSWLGFDMYKSAPLPEIQHLGFSLPTKQMWCAAEGVCYLII